MKSLYEYIVDECDGGGTPVASVAGPGPNAATPANTMGMGDIDGEHLEGIPKSQTVIRNRKRKKKLHK